MSLFAAYCGRKEAHIVTDTFAFRGDDSFVGILPKAVPLVPRNIVIAGRGNFETVETVIDQFRLTSETTDEIGDRLVQTTQAVFEEYYRENLKPAADFSSVNVNDLEAAYIQIVAIGWSDRHKSFVGYAVWNNREGEWAFETRHKQFFGAPVPTEDKLPVLHHDNPRLPGDLIKLAKAQYLTISGVAEDRGYETELCGGELIHYRITNDAVKYSTIYEFPNRGRFKR